MSSANISPRYHAEHLCFLITDHSGVTVCTLYPSSLRQAEEELNELHIRCSCGKHLHTSVPLDGRYHLKCSSVQFCAVQNTAAVINIPSMKIQNWWLPVVSGKKTRNVQRLKRNLDIYLKFKPKTRHASNTESTRSKLPLNPVNN